MMMVPFLFIAGAVFAYFVVLPERDQGAAELQLRQLRHPRPGQGPLQVHDPHLHRARARCSRSRWGSSRSTRMEIVTVAQLRANRRYAILVIAVLAMLLPGTDPITMLLSMVPLVFLYEASILIAALLDRRARARATADDGRAGPALATRTTTDAMLFDLRGRGRRNTIKVIYITLAFLMGGGLVLFGIGGNTSGGLVDAITGSSSQRRRRRRPLREGDRGGQEDARRQPEGRGRLRRADPRAGLPRRHRRAVRLEHRRVHRRRQGRPPRRRRVLEGLPGDRPQGHRRGGPRRLPHRPGLRRPRATSRASSTPRRSSPLNRNAVGPYAALAQYAYLAGQTRKGDLAAKKALELEDPDQRAAAQGRPRRRQAAGAQQAAQPPPPPSPPSPRRTPRRPPRTRSASKASRRQAKPEK